MSKQRFHTMTAIKSFVFKHVVAPEFHLTSDEFAEKFDLSAPDELFDLMCTCDEEVNAIALCRSANRADVLDSAKWDVAPSNHVNGMIGRTAMIKIKSVRSIIDMMPPMVPVLDEKAVIDRKISYAENPFSTSLCGICNKMFCTCLPFVDPAPEKCKGCDIPFCECWDGKPDPNAKPEPLTYTHEPAEPGSCFECEGDCKCHEPFNGVAYFGSEPVELPCMGVDNGCVCSKCVPF